MKSIKNFIQSLALFHELRTIKPLYYLLILLGIGTIGFYFLKNNYSPENQHVTLYDSLYFAVISLTTVGYGDNLELLLLPEPGKTAGIIFTVMYLLLGYGVILWAFSTSYGRTI